MAKEYAGHSKLAMSSADWAIKEDSWCGAPLTQKGARRPFLSPGYGVSQQEMLATGSA